MKKDDTIVSRYVYIKVIKIIMTKKKKEQDYYDYPMGSTVKHIVLNQTLIIVERL